VAIIASLFIYLQIIMKTNRGTGTLSEAVYFLKIQAAALQRRANDSRDPDFRKMLRIRADACIGLAEKLSNELKGIGKKK
jgi:hypothetical protein